MLRTIATLIPLGALLSITTMTATEPAQTPPAEPLRLGIVGLVHGHVYGFLQDAVKRPDIKIVGIADPSEELLHRYGKHHHKFDDAVLFRDLDEMLDQARPEAVAVFTDARDHRAVIEACARRKIHVMVEKPLAVSLEHARAIERAARSGGIHVIVNYETTWYPNVQTALEMIRDKQQIGEIRKMVLHFGHRGPKEINVPHEFLDWLTDPERNGGGALVDFGCYGANLATCLMGGQRPLAVVAVTQQLKSDPAYARVDDEATIILTYPKAQAIIQASWNWPLDRKDMEIYGEHGIYYTLGRADYRLRSAHGPDKTGRGTPPSPGDPISYLIAVARGKIEPAGPSSLEINLIAEEILEAARQSARTGKRVELESRSGAAK